MTLPHSLEPLELAASDASARLYAELTSDFNPIHLDASFAAQTAFGRPIAHGTMSLNLVLEAAAATFGADHECSDIDIRFVRPLPIGDVVRAGGSLVDADAGTYEIFAETVEGVRVLEGTLRARRLQPPQS